MKNVLKKNKNSHLFLFANSTYAKIILYLLFALLSLEIVFAQESALAFNKARTSSQVFGTTSLGSIGSVVWKDKNNDGVKNDNEYGIGGVIIELYQIGQNNETQNAFFAKTVSNTFGKYMFTDLPAGNYQVKVVLASLPANHQLSAKVIRRKITDFAANFDPTNGFSETITIDPNKKDILGVGIGVAPIDCSPICVPISAQVIK